MRNREPFPRTARPCNVRQRCVQECADKSRAAYLLESAILPHPSNDGERVNSAPLHCCDRGEYLALPRRVEVRCRESRGRYPIKDGRVDQTGMQDGMLCGEVVRNLTLAHCAPLISVTAGRRVPAGATVADALAPPFALCAARYAKLQTFSAL